MGISTNFYTVYGIKDEPFGDFDDAYDAVYDDKDTPNVIIDGMGGDYQILGTILFDSGDQRWGECEDTFVEIDLDKLPEIESEYKKQFVAKFPQFASMMDAPFKLFSFVHYS